LTSGALSCGTTPSRARIRGPSAAGSIPRTCSAPPVTGDAQPNMRIIDVFRPQFPAGDRTPSGVHFHIDPVDRRASAEPLGQTASMDESAIIHRSDRP
jgi:hypothetical protein